MLVKLKYAAIEAAILGFVLALTVVCAVLVSIAANAADKNGGGIFADAPLAPSASWTGPSIAIGAGWNVGMASVSGPVGAAAEGGSVSGTLGYDKQWGSVVGGVFLGYSHFFGDLESIGVNYDLFGGARLGVLMTPTNLLYGHLGYGRLSTDDANINGWRLGLGDEIKLPNSPFSLDLRYTYGIHDTDKTFGPAVETRSHTFGSALVWRFNP